MTTRQPLTLDGAYLLPRTLVATRRLLRGDGVAGYRATFPGADRGRPTTSAARVATHAALGLLLGAVTVLVVGLVVLALLLSPLLLAPAGLGGVAALTGVGAAHRQLTRRLVDRPTLPARGPDRPRARVTAP